MTQERREAERRYREWVADPEQQILHAIAQIRVVHGLLRAAENVDGSSPFMVDGIEEAAYRLTQASLDTFERLDVVGLVVKARS